jgi:hypothetical protein
MASDKYSNIITKFNTKIHGNALFKFHKNSIKYINTHNREWICNKNIIIYIKSYKRYIIVFNIYSMRIELLSSFINNMYGIEFKEGYIVYSMYLITEWYMDNKLGRDGDMPASICYHPKIWYQNGIQCRDGDNPGKLWYQNGLLHREGDKPAKEYINGDKIWYKYGLKHRDGDKPAIERADGTRKWYRNGLLHRDGDKPAIEYDDGDKIWYKYGILLRRSTSRYK